MEERESDVQSQVVGHVWAHWHGSCQAVVFVIAAGFSFLLLQLRRTRRS